ncbi:MAG: SDR family oxidoreductase [Xanthobacteraceae bacterium]
MQILITGAAGMIGRKLAERLGRDGTLNGAAIRKLTLTDIVPPTRPPGFAGEAALVPLDLAAPGAAERLVADRPDVVFHLAGVVSAEAELDFDKGWRVNFDGTRALLDAIRGVGGGYRPKVVFTSSIAVFGAPFPEAIGDDFHLTPHTSYGTQKAICEHMLADYSRRGFIDGVGLRLPTICVRPAPPNKAASAFFSSIIREPLVGQEAILPVPDSVLQTHASPRAAVGFLLHAAALNPDQLGLRINLTMPGVCCTVAEQIEALRRIAGDKAVALIRRATDPLIARIVGGWPRRFDPRRALALGFAAESSFDDIIRIHIEDELGGTIAV